ncbi:uncharacterized protein PFB0765w-like [Pogonomyrmex barbatus]|uniref:Uncharacterized protein PFB0765w-like n=1 Tax=Pogonomyrmex barbatus TaxID=144034 RepID=A0A6I9WP41_9HYME|nr:uncharacterized protein PFB0765w-like [Pogonomyrmex barbatus]
MIAGIYSSKEEIQLKAPTDLSFFERLKGSLKSFLSQHMTPQATTIASNLDMMIPVIESQEDQEDIIDFHYFHAEIVKDSLGGEVRITAASEATIIVLRPVSTPMEILWHQLKEVFVNQIFINSKQNRGIRIRSFILESYYNWVNKARGIVTKTSLSYKVRWFLSELLVVAPNSSIKKMGQLLQPNKQKLLKQYLLTNMDTMVLNLKTVATKLKSMKSVRPEMEQLLKISESGIAQVENYSFLRHLLTDLFDEDEIINQHIVLLDRIHAEVHTMYQEILIDGVQRHLEKSGIEDSSYYDILIADLQKNLKNIDKGENLFGKTKENNVAVAEFISDSNGGNKLELEDKNIKIFKKTKELSTEKLEDIEYFILTEIEKAVKYSEQNILQKYEDISDESRNIVKGNEEDKKAIKSNDVTLQSTQNQSKGENRKKIQSTLQEEIDFLRISKVVDAKLKETSKDKQRKNSYINSVSDDTNKIHISNMPLTIDISNIRTASPNKKHTVLQELGKDIDNVQRNREINLKAESSNQKDSFENKIISTDLLEAFEKSKWDINEEKISEKKSDITDTRYNFAKSNEINYDEEKYMNKDEDKEAKPKSHKIAKHIDDEL